MTRRTPVSKLLRSTNQCRSYNTGHCVHWIQARHSWKDKTPGQTRVSALVLDVTADGWVELELDGGEVVTRWVHEPDLLIRALDAVTEMRTQVNLYWSLLEHGASFSLATNPSPCVFDKPSGDLVRDLETHGGFSVTGESAARYLNQHRADEP